MDFPIVPGPERSAYPLLPAAPVGSFRLFRLLSLFPTPTIEIQVFRYRRPAARSLGGPSNIARSVLDHPRSIDSADDADIIPCPPYDAISYAWNPKSQTSAGTDAEQQHVSIGQFLRTDPLGSEASYSPSMQPITVHTKPAGHHTQPSSYTMHISDHLLYGLSTAQETQAPTWLFVDVICVDQTDPLDKAVHVQEMHHIFGGAKKVLIWLGNDFPRSGSDFSLSDTQGTPGIRCPNDAAYTPSLLHAELDPSDDFHHGACLARIPILADKLETFLNTERQRQIYEFELRSGGTPDPTAFVASTELFSLLRSMPQTLWSALKRLRLNPWFFRLWILQEIALAREPIILYGQHSLPWLAYARLTAMCEKAMSRPPPSDYEGDLVGQLDLAYNRRVSAMIKFKGVLQSSRSLNPNDLRVGSDSTNENSLIQLIHYNIRMCRCTLPIDYVYAVLGLLDPAIKHNLYVDYAAEAQDQYWTKWMELSYALLTTHPELLPSFLSAAAYLQPYPTLPSWGLNLMDDNEIRLLHGSGTGAGTLPDEQGQSLLTVAYPSLITNTTIYVPTIRLDQVQHTVDLSCISPILQTSDVTPPTTAQDVLSTIWKCLTYIQSTNNSTSSGDEILARTLTLNSYDGTSAPHMEKLLDEYIAFTQCLDDDTWGARLGGMAHRKKREMSSKFGKRFCEVTRAKVFFVTSTGRAGICGQRVRVGDVLCVVVGWRMPWLFRKRAIEIGAVNSNQDIGSGIGGDNDAGASSDANREYELISEAYVDGIMNGEMIIGRDLVMRPPENIMIT